MRPTDVIGVGTQGLRSRPARTLLTAMGIAIGIASMVAVLGISSSSKAELLAEIDALGTNLLQIRAGQSVFGAPAELPAYSQVMVDRIGTVTRSAAVTHVPADVVRNRHDTTPNGLAVVTADEDLLGTLGGGMRIGRFVDNGAATLPVVVLGSVAAERLGIVSLAGGPEVTIADHPFQVIGILDPMPLNPDLDRAVFIGPEIAHSLLDADARPTSIYVRTDLDRVEETRAVLARTASPAAPNEVEVSRPSDALEARARVDENLQNLLLALGGVALLVGGVGIANVMVISVLERRSEIGVRRAMGATRGHIRAQFVIESAALASLGGLLGAAFGTGITAIYADRQGWPIDIPIAGLAYGVAAALAAGVLAGLYPAVKAARVDPADAVRPGS